MTSARSVIGDAPKRREDLRFITGRGGYLDDLAFEGLTHAVVLLAARACTDRAHRYRSGASGARCARGIDSRGRAGRRTAAIAALRGSQCDYRRAVRVRA